MSDLCKRGHELAGDNLLIQHGRRVCRTDTRAAQEAAALFAAITRSAA